MNKKRCLFLSIISLLSFLSTSLHAGESLMSESICGRVMDQIKSIISHELSKIPNRPYFIQKSSTRIGQITTTMWGVSDCVIRSVHGQEKAVIFFYDTNLSTHVWTKNIPSTTQKIKIPALYKATEGAGVTTDSSELDLKIGIICRDKKLLSEIIEWLNKIDTDKITTSVTQWYKKHLNEESLTTP